MTQSTQSFINSPFHSSLSSSNSNKTTCWKIGTMSWRESMCIGNSQDKIRSGSPDLEVKFVISPKYLRAPYFEEVKEYFLKELKKEKILDLVKEFLVTDTEIYFKNSHKNIKDYRTSAFLCSIIRGIAWNPVIMYNYYWLRHNGIDVDFWRCLLAASVCRNSNQGSLPISLDTGHYLFCWEHLVTVAPFPQEFPEIPSKSWYDSYRGQYNYIFPVLDYKDEDCSQIKAKGNKLGSLVYDLKKYEQLFKGEL